MDTSDIHTGHSIVKKIVTWRENYESWKVAMKIILSFRSQLGFIRGEYAKPSDPMTMARWQRCNNVFMSWLILSVSEEIGEHILRVRDVTTA